MWRFFLPTTKVLSVALAAYLVATPALKAQSNTKLKGHVFDSDIGAPVQGAVVELPGTGYKALTDKFGWFGFNNLPTGEYTLAVSAIGYESFTEKDIRIITDVTQQVNVRLCRKTYYLGRFTVKAKRVQSSTDKVEVILKDHIEKTGARNLPDLLETVHGVFIQKMGVSGGKSQIRIRGSTPGQVLVLLDGQKVNPSGDGVADLSTIPIEIVERIEIHKGGASAEFGANALGGVLNIVTQKEALSNHLSVTAGRTWGKWMTKCYDFAVSDPISSASFSSKFACQLRQSNGDFDYSYEVHPNPVSYEGNRSNNQMNSYNYFASGIYQFNERLKLAYSGQYYHSESGLPGRASNENMYAASDDSRKLLNTSLKYEKPFHCNARLDLAFSRFEQHFLDEKSIMKFNGEYINDIFTARHSQQHAVWNGNQARLGAKFQRDILYHTDYHRPQMSMGKTIRDNFALFFSDVQRFDVSRFLIIDDIAFDGSLCFDRSKTQKDSTSWHDTVKTNSVEYWSPKIGVAVSKGERFSYTMRGSYGKSFGLPTINALFWKGDARSRGNPGLKPEKSEHSEAGIELEGALGSLCFSGGLTYFHSRVKDLVVWLPRSGVWQPVNMEKSQITGHEDFIKLDLFDKTLSVMYQNTITTALNKSPGHTMYNKRLVFCPHYITSVTSRCDFHFLNISYSIRWVDRAYTNTSNTKYYNSYRIDDLHIGLKFDIARIWRVTAGYDLNNVWDESYVLMTHYPMPGREWNIELKIAYGIHDSD